jgi:hypothetical protein
LSALPTGWRGRLIKVQNANTAAPDGELQYTGWCLDKEDLCVAKPCAFREKDQNFVDREAILSRLAAVDERYRRAADVAAPGSVRWKPPTDPGRRLSTKTAHRVPVRAGRGDVALPSWR